MADFGMPPVKDPLVTASSASDNRLVKQYDSFWHDPAIEGIRWNQLFPYQLLVVQSTKNGYVRSKDWEFTLPFPPSSLSNQMAIAISGQVTQGGYVEEHNGVPIENFSLSGSLGVLPLRGSSGTSPAASFGQAILAGTVNQVQKTARSAQGFVSNFTGTNSAFEQQNLVADADFGKTGSLAKTSGYYQMLLLKSFLRNYAKMKTKKKYKDYRLAFAIWKQNAIYLVTPTGFSVNQEASSPLEYVYNLSLRAYKRIQLNEVSPKAINGYTPTVRQPNGLARILKGILDARDVLENAADILGAVAKDVDATVFTPLRETGLFVKDLLGVKTTFTDFPNHIKRDAQDAVVVYTTILEDSKEPSAKKRDKTGESLRKLADVARTIDATKRNKGSAKIQSNEAFAPFNYPEEHYDFWKSLAPGDMNLPTVVQDGIIAERERVREYTRSDFEEMRDQLKEVAADFADAVGAGSAVYNEVFQRKSVVANKTPTGADYQVLYALQKGISQLNKLAATTETSIKYDPIAYIAGLARRSGIAFTEPRSKFLVPFPYGFTLEKLAALYLGDPDRWLEIAALNGLRSPWVDEVGFQVPLLTSGSGNEVVVASIDNLYVGQPVWLVAHNTMRTQRKITQIVSSANDLHTVVLDGDDDLERFTVAGLAAIQAYLPDTVNSQMSIYIPSQEEPGAQSYVGKEIPGVSQYSTLLAAGGIDLLLDDNFDIILSEDGSTRFAVGLQNFVQHVKILLSIYKGSLIRHSSVGLSIEPGTTIAETSAKDLAKSLKEMFADDPVVESVGSVAVSLVGGRATLSMSIKAYGVDQLIPISIGL